MSAPHPPHTLYQPKVIKIVASGDNTCANVIKNFDTEIFQQDLVMRQSVGDLDYVNIRILSLVSN